MSPLFPLVLAQSINQSTGFSSNTCRMVSEAVIELQNAWPNKKHFLNVCNDALCLVIYMSQQHQLLHILMAKLSILEEWMQIIRPSLNERTDSGLIKVAGIAVDLWRIRDYASDASPIVPKLCSYTAAHKIMECLHTVQPNSDTTEMNQATLKYVLLFNQEFLYAVNRKGPLSAHGCIWMIWSATASEMDVI
eukprot:scaffold178690_cov53-Attheya_sp.AAC.4